MRLRILCILLVSFFSGAAQSADNALVGKWAADTRTKGGLGAMFIFADDGSVTSIFGALVDFKYVADGKTLKCIDTDTQKVVTDQPYEVSDDKLILNPADPKGREVRTRVGEAKPGAPPIVGVWSFKHYTGVMATEQLTSGGISQLSVPMLTVLGRYKLDKDELTLDMKNQPALTRKIVLSGDHLTLLPGGDKPEQKFTRVIP